MNDIVEKAVDDLYARLKKDAESNGYHLGPDVDFTKELIRGLIANQERYGYMACPCRLASGKKDEDLDIVCPCDYRDPDLDDFGMCYCCLYVSEKVAKGEQKTRSIPDRRPPGGPKISPPKPAIAAVGVTSLPLPVWRCKVCGYLCARENPPETCPICKVKKDRFERFM
jgi:ferredoxin-thioredoxin reductase catalytic chain